MDEPKETIIEECPECGAESYFSYYKDEGMYKKPMLQCSFMGHTFPAPREYWIKKYSPEATKMKKNRYWSKKAKYKHIPGYKISLSARARRTSLSQEITRRRDAISVMRSLQMIINLNKSKYSDQIMQRDIKWIRAKYSLPRIP